MPYSQFELELERLLPPLLRYLLQSRLKVKVPYSFAYQYQHFYIITFLHYYIIPTLPPAWESCGWHSLSHPGQ